MAKTAAAAATAPVTEPATGRGVAKDEEGSDDVHTCGAPSPVLCSELVLLPMECCRAWCLQLASATGKGPDQVPGGAAATAAAVLEGSKGATLWLEKLPGGRVPCMAMRGSKLAAAMPLVPKHSRGKS